MSTRQLLGQTTRRYLTQHGPDIQGIESILLSVLRHVLPKTSGEDLNKAVAKFVKKSVALKNEFVEEPAVYRLYWVKSGENVDSGTIQTAVGDKGPVVFCTFPGLSSVVRSESGISQINIYKACAVRSSSIR